MAFPFDRSADQITRGVGPNGSGKSTSSATLVVRHHAQVWRGYASMELRPPDLSIYERSQIGGRVAKERGERLPATVAEYVAPRGLPHVGRLGIASARPDRKAMGCDVVDVDMIADDAPWFTLRRRNARGAIARALAQAAKVRPRRADAFLDAVVTRDDRRELLASSPP